MAVDLWPALLFIHQCLWVKGVIFNISVVLLRPLKRDKTRGFKRRNDWPIKTRVTYYFPHHRESDPRQRGYRIFWVLCYFRWLTWWWWWWWWGVGAEVTWISLRLTKECESCPARFRYFVAAVYVYNAGGRHFGPRGRHLSAAGTKCCSVPNRGSNNTVQNIAWRVSARRRILLRASNLRRRRVRGM
jgi:hypothetical protein